MVAIAPAGSASPAAVADGSSGPPRAGWWSLLRLAWLPVPLFLLAIIVLKVHEPKTAYEHPYLLLLLNFIFSLVASALVIVLLARSFVVRGTAHLLLVICGLCAWGLAGSVGVAAGLIGVGGTFSNSLVTVHNECVWLAGALLFAGALLTLRPGLLIRRTGFWLAMTQAAVVALVGTVAIASLAGWAPTFFIPGQGGTPLRQAVMYSASALFAAAAAFFSRSPASRTERSAERRRASTFESWYAAALALIAVGLLGVTLQTVVGGLLGWVGRSAQYLGGVYLVVAAVTAVRQSRAWGVALELAAREATERLHVSEEQLRLAQSSARVGVWDWDLSSATVSWTPELERLYGYAEGTFPGTYDAFRERVHPDDLAEMERRWREAVDAHRSFDFDFRVQPSAGETRWLNCKGAAVYDEAGKPRRVFGVNVDFTERKQMELELHKRQIELQSLFNNANAGLVLFDAKPPYTVLAHNRYYQELFAEPFRTQGMVGRNVHEYAPAAEAQGVVAVFNEVVKSGKARSFLDFPYDSHPPQKSWFNWHLSPIVQEGNVVALASMSINVTDRHKAEEALRQSQKTFSELVERAPFGIYVIDSQFRIAMMNAGSQTGAFRNVRPVIGRDFSEAMRILWPEPVAAEIIGHFRHTLETGEPYCSPRFTSARHDLEVVESYEWELHRMMLPDGQDGVICYYFDSTKLRDAEHALRGSIRQREVAQEQLERSHQKVNEILASIQDDFYVLDRDWKFVFASRSFTSRIGKEPKDFLGNCIWEMFPKHVGTPFAENLHAAMEKGETRRFEVGGKYTDAIYSMTAFPSAEGITVLGTDITARKRAEEALRQLNAELEQRVTDRTAELAKAGEEVRAERQRFLDVLETLPVMITLIRPDYHVPFANRAYREALGEARGRTCFDYQFGRDKPCEECQAFTPLATGQPHHWEWTLPTGRTFEIHNFPFTDADHSPMILEMDIDVTEQRRAEREVRAAQAELAARADQLRRLTGELTLVEQRERRRMAKVLHDHLQQLLVGARFRIAVLGRTDDELVAQAAGEIEGLLDESIRASQSLTAELSPPILHEGGLGPGLEWLARWMADKHGLMVDLSIEETLPTLLEDVKVLLFESVRELLFNAVKHARVRAVGVRLRSADGGLQITVSDSGPGFDPAALKPTGELGGFGLFSIRERLSLIGGRLEIDSAPGDGSRFTLVAPLNRTAAPEPLPELAYRAQAGADPSPTGPAGQVSSPKPGARIRVLLADDHAVMREGLSRLLGQERDIEVIGQAANGHEAVRLATHLLPDVVLMDVSMPSLNGVEATRAIHNDYPDIRIIGLSMFEEAERAQAMRDAGAVGYLAKSGPAADLISAIRGDARGKRPAPASRARPARRATRRRPARRRK